MDIEQFDTERLRQIILNELYAGAFAGMSAKLMEAEDSCST